MADLPTGTVTFLFTDIEGSTRLLQQLGISYAAVLEEHLRLLRGPIQSRGGQEVDTQGDALFAAFSSARNAVAAAIEGQRAILTNGWPNGIGLRVRMGLHTGEAVATLKRYVGVDVHRAARICAAGHGGQILVSQTTRDLVGNDLPERVFLRDLGEHRLQDLVHPQRLFQVLAPDLPEDFPALRTPDVFPNNLPIQLTSFIGREREKAAVKRLFATTRLLVLTGSGGAGKTRLALEVAGELLDQHPDGVWLVELANVGDPAMVAQTVIAALGVREEVGRPTLAILTDYLRFKRVLLLLDNCEHLLETCADLIEALLRSCPHLRIMATSREAFGIAGELAYRVPSLSLPSAEQPSIEQLMQSEAARLFVERAAFSQPEFRVTPRNAAAMAQLCQRLDGIPLAIELAAARVKALAVEEIAARLDDRFRLLTGGSRRALPRQQTLRATMDWSYGLLAEEERSLLRRLSVFAGGFQFDAVESICAEDGTDSSELLDRLAHLVDKSLVLAEERGGETRYRLLETVRQYGWEKLVETGGAETIRRLHRDWYLALAERATPELRGPRQKHCLERLGTEHDNLRAALAWSQAEPIGAEPGLRLAGALWWFWSLHGNWTEGRRWAETLLQRDDAASCPSYAKALIVAAFFAWRHDDVEQAKALAERGLAVVRDSGDQESCMWLLFNLGITALRSGDAERADAILGEAATLAETLGNRWAFGMFISQQGVVARNVHDYARAVRIHTEALAAMRAIGDPSTTAYQLRNLGMDTLRQGLHDQAEAYFREGLELCRDIGAPWFTEECLEGLAGVAATRGHYERAVRLFGAVEATRKLIGHVRGRIDQADFDRRVDGARTQLGEQAFSIAWNAGQAMTLEQAIQYALADPG